MVEVFREVRRVLSAGGTLWLNLGDSYAQGSKGNSGAIREGDKQGTNAGSLATRRGEALGPNRNGGTNGTCKPKDLIGIPWRVAFALQQPYYAGQIKREADRLWLAAMIDTEGSICIDILKADKANRKKDSYSVNIRVHNTSEALVRRCAEIAGMGKVHLHDERRRPVYQWSVYGDNAKAVLREVYPHLVAKRQEARIGYGRVDAEGYAALRLLHAGSETSVNPPEPPTLFEPGWYLRSDIIWSKPNPMPESVTDRPTKAHEYVFLLSKQPRYFFDAEAVREAFLARPQQRLTPTIKQPLGPARVAAGVQQGNVQGGAHVSRFAVQAETLRVESEDCGCIEAGCGRTFHPSDCGCACHLPGEAPRGPDGRRKTTVRAADGSIQHRDGERWPNSGRNIRSVWEIATQPYPEAHFATFPEELARRCIAAGCPEQVCRVCGAPRTRLTSTEYVQHRKGGKWQERQQDERGSARSPAYSKNGTGHNETTTTGWSDCGHADYRPGIVLDPFIGSGTVAYVARKLGRRSIGIDLSAEYLALAARRLQQQSLFAEGANA